MMDIGTFPQGHVGSPSPPKTLSPSRRGGRGVCNDHNSAATLTTAVTITTLTTRRGRTATASDGAKRELDQAVAHALHATAPRTAPGGALDSDLGRRASALDACGLIRALGPKAENHHNELRDIIISFHDSA